MLDALLGMAVEGAKQLLSSEIGHRAVHVAAHKAGHAAMEMFEHHHNNQPQPQTYSEDYISEGYINDSAASYNPSDANHFNMSLFTRVQQVIVGQLGVNADQITYDTSFIDDLGVDSLDSVELIMAFEEEFGIAIPEEDAGRLFTVGRVIAYLQQIGIN